MRNMLKKIVTVFVALAMVLPTMVTKIAFADGVTGWNVSYNGGCDAQVLVDNTTGYGSSSSMKVEVNSPAVGNVYVMITQAVPVEAGKKYYVGSTAKSNKMEHAQMCVDWGTRYGFETFSKSFDWRTLEFLYIPTATKTVTFQIIIEGKTSGIWFDNFKFEDAETGKNLLVNPDFDSGDGEASKPTYTGDIKYPQHALDNAGLADRLKEMDSFSTDELKKVSATLGFLPIYPAKNIVIDGKNDDWEDYPAFPISLMQEQYCVLVPTDKLIDMNAICKIAYDQNRIYLMVEVEDDIHDDTWGGAYWQRDSVQFMVAAADEGVGKESGMCYHPGKDEMEFVGDYALNLETKGSRVGTKTIYEMSVLWESYFSMLPNSFLMDVLVNDNDGDGRNTCAEMVYGICYEKTSRDYPVCQPLQEGQKIYGWIKPKGEVFKNEEATFKYYIANDSDEAKKVQIKEYGSNEIKEKDIAAHTVISGTFKETFDSVGQSPITMSYTIDGTSTDIEYLVKVKTGNATPEDAERIIAKIEEEAKVINELVDKCNQRGISTDYENIAKNILNDFPNFIREDVQYGDLDRVFYTEETTDKIYQEAYEDLNAYLEGKKDPLNVPRYLTSVVNIDGETMWGYTEDYNGKIEYRPLYQVGHLIFSGGEKAVKEMIEYGYNAVQLECIVDQAMSCLPAWTEQTGNVTALVSPDTENAISGEKCIKLVQNSEPSPGGFFCVQQDTSKKIIPGNSYTFKCWVKGSGTEKGFAAIRADGWDDSTSKYIGGDVDWEEVNISFTAKEKNSRFVHIAMYGENGAELYVDGMELIDNTTGENIIINGDFEEAYDEPHFYAGPGSEVSNILDVISACEENNVAVSFLLGANTLPISYVEKYDIAYTGPGFCNNNVNSPEAKRLVDDYLRNLIPLLKDYKCIQNICLVNEPQFHVDTLPDFYNPLWWEFLKDRYNNDIEELNTSYETAFSSFEEVDMLTPDGCPKMKIYDYNTFNSKMYTGWQKWLADTVHEILPDMAVQSKVMGYIHAGGALSAMYMGNEQQMFAEFSDMAGNDYWRYYANGSDPLNKSFWYDYQRSVIAAPIANTEDHIIPDRNRNYDLNVAKYTSQDIYMGGIHGRGFDTIWHWARTLDPTNMSHGGVRMRPDVLKEIGDASLDLQRLSYEINALQTEKTEVGVLYSTPTAFADSTNIHAMYEAWRAGLMNGKRVQFVVDSQLYKMHNTDVMIVPNSKWVVDGTLEELKKFIDNGGKLIILGNDALSRTDKNKPTDSALRDYLFNNAICFDYNGGDSSMMTPTSVELFDTVANVLKELGLEYVTVLDAETNKRINNIEYNVSAYDGKIIINFNNDNKATKVKITVDGKPVTEMTNLRTMEKMSGEVITLEQYIPLTVSVECDNPFFDTWSHWSKDEISAVFKKGIVKGVTNSHFEPQRNITRAEFLALITRACGYEETAYNGEISDVKTDDWFAGNVAQALKEGIISTENFRPNDVITREEMCGILIKAYEHENGTASGTTVSFSDILDITDISSVEKAAALGFMKGNDDGTFAPKAGSTRAEAAAVINRFMQSKANQ